MLFGLNKGDRRKPKTKLGVECWMYDFVNLGCATLLEMEPGYAKTRIRREGMREKLIDV